VEVLVTGASGFLGSHVAEQLVGEGHRVRLLLRKTSSRQFLSFSHEERLGDITDVGSLVDAVNGVGAVVHAAGLVKARNEAEFAAANTLGTANLLSAIRQSNPDLGRFVYVSSLAAHGPSADGSPRDVHAPPNPITAYGRTKLAGEDLTRNSSIAARSVVIRPPAIYGPRDSALVPFFQLARFRLAPLLMGGRNRISIVYVEDVARAIVQAISSEASGGKVYCPEDGAVHTWRDLQGAVERAVGHRAVRMNAPRWTFTVAAVASEAVGFLKRRAVSLTREKVRELAQPHWVCSGEDLRRDLDWSPRVTIREGAALTYDWYRKHRWV